MIGCAGRPLLLAVFAAVFVNCGFCQSTINIAHLETLLKEDPEVYSIGDINELKAAANHVSMPEQKANLFYHAALGEIEKHDLLGAVSSIKQVIAADSHADVYVAQSGLSLAAICRVKGFATVCKPPLEMIRSRNWSNYDDLVLGRGNYVQHLANCLNGKVSLPPDSRSLIALDDLVAKSGTDPLAFAALYQRHNEALVANDMQKCKDIELAVKPLASRYLEVIDFPISRLNHGKEDPGQTAKQIASQYPPECSRVPYAMLALFKEALHEKDKTLASSLANDLFTGNCAADSLYPYDRFKLDIFQDLRIYYSDMNNFSEGCKVNKVIIDHFGKDQGAMTPQMTTLINECSRLSKPRPRSPFALNPLVAGGLVFLGSAIGVAFVARSRR